MPPPRYPLAPSNLQGADLMRWISRASQTLRLPPGMPGIGPRPGPVSSGLFNPFARLTPAQITDLRHNSAFRAWMQTSADPIAQMWRRLHASTPPPRYQYNPQGPPFKPRPQWTPLGPGQRPLPPSQRPGF
jgi:hypothetical protein